MYVSPDMLLWADKFKLGGYSKTTCVTLSTIKYLLSLYMIMTENCFDWLYNLRCEVFRNYLKTKY